MFVCLLFNQTQYYMADHLNIQIYSVLSIDV